MKEDWVHNAVRLSRRKADFFSGARKIIRNVHFTFENINPDLQYADAGYTSHKRTALNKLYKHEESLAKAVEMWDVRKGQDKYGSVGFHCYNHLLKADPTKGSKRASKMGPCLQAVNLTYLADGGRRTAIDVFYRTTELFKKFPADLVFLRDDILTRFNFDGCPISEINFHFGNVTLHPMYFVVLMPHLEDAEKELDLLKKRDPKYYEWIVKWTARYLCPEHKRGIQKFAQAMRVHDEAHKILKPRQLKSYQKYLRDNHPGYRNEYKDPDMGGDEE
jgi:hypothetical protein